MPYTDHVTFGRKHAFRQTLDGHPLDRQSASTTVTAVVVALVDVARQPEVGDFYVHAIIQPVANVLTIFVLSSGKYAREVTGVSEYPQNTSLGELTALPTSLAGLKGALLLRGGEDKGRKR